MKYLDYIKQCTTALIARDFGHALNITQLNIDVCKKEFEGDYTLLVFPLVKLLGKGPEILAQTIGEELLAQQCIEKYNVVKGFLNFTLLNNFWIDQYKNLLNPQENDYKLDPIKQSSYLLEYCSPNTNKPLHLGHIRNILLGWSTYKILKAIGHDVETTQVTNDRGIAICKSMLAWQKYADGKTPLSANIKGDHFVGDYYVMFEQKFKEEYISWQSSEEAETLFKAKHKPEEDKNEFFINYKNEYFNSFSILGNEAKLMLRNWEMGDPNTIALWKQMNNWVYSGFTETFNALGVRFDSNYYESQTYLLGKDIVENGLKKNVFYKLPDGSTWIDLTDKGLDKKVVLRSDGTSVYITQDLGTAHQRHAKHQKQHYLYVVADEQDYHFKVLFEILKKLGEPYAEGMHHISYGMVELTTGKMKSREGTVVDADDIIAEVIQEARLGAEDRGELSHLSEDEKAKIVEQIGMSALKYFILKVQAKKRMIFNPAESLDMQGHTGPYIVNAFVRIKSILRKKQNISNFKWVDKIEEAEKELIKALIEYPNILEEAAHQFDPSHLANYLYQLAKSFHKYYHDCRILNAETEDLIQWRIGLCQMVASKLEHGMSCLGIEMPERM